MCSRKHRNPRVWDARTATEVPALVSTSEVGVAGFGQGGRTIVTANYDGDVVERDLSSGAQLSTHQVGRHTKPDGYFGTFRAAYAISEDGLALLVEWSNAEIGVWDIASQRIISILEPASGLRHPRFSADRQRLVALETSGASVWDTASGRKLATLRQKGSDKSAAFSPDGRTVATTAQGGEVRLWDGDSGRELKVVGTHSGANGAAFSPDGRACATAGWDIRVWPVMLRGQALIELACAQAPWPLSPVQRERVGVTTERCTPEVAAALRKKR